MEKVSALTQEHFRKFLRALRMAGVDLHSVLIWQGGKMQMEKYWAPFDENTPHRMYSVTKSFVGIAVGCLIDDGLVKLNDPIIKYFPEKLPDTLHEFVRQQTIEDMLTMRTCYADNPSWIDGRAMDIPYFYFRQPVRKPVGAHFDYDSTGSYVLGALVEKLTGKTLLAYLKEKFLDEIGGFENAQTLCGPDGVTWGSSAMICKPRGLMNFALLLKNHGAWNGRQLISADYVKRAISRMTDNDFTGCSTHKSQGYGYQIWHAERGGFAFHGLGGQFAICVPEADFAFVCTADIQMTYELHSGAIFRAVYDELVTPLLGEEETDDLAPEKLNVARGEKESAYAGKISGKTYKCEENPMGIKWFRMDFDGHQGCFSYENAQGEKKLPFGMKENVFGQFPQFGYSNEQGGLPGPDDFTYACAASAGWVEEKKLQIKVQIIDRYIGKLIMVFSFLDNSWASVKMTKGGQDFLDEYKGWIIAWQLK